MRPAWKVSLLIPLTLNWRKLTRSIFTRCPIIGEKEPTGKPVIRLFGVNANGNSVCAHVHNFTAYFYVHIIENAVTLSSDEIEEFRIKLNRSISEPDAVLEIEVVEKYPIMNYQADKQKFLKLYCANPMFVARLRA